MSERQFEILSFKGYSKNTPIGFADVVTPEGMILHGVSIHQKGESRWCGWPSKPFTDRDGKAGFSPILEFTDRAAADRFRDNVLEALDRYQDGGRA